MTKLIGRPPKSEIFTSHIKISCTAEQKVAYKAAGGSKWFHAVLAQHMQDAGLKAKKSDLDVGEAVKSHAKTVFGVWG